MKKLLIIVVSIVSLASPVLGDTPKEVCRDIQVLTEMMVSKMPSCDYVKYEGIWGYNIDFGNTTPKEAVLWSLANVASENKRMSNETSFVVVSTAQFIVFIRMEKVLFCTKIGSKSMTVLKTCFLNFSTFRMKE